MQVKMCVVVVYANYHYISTPTSFSNGGRTAFPLQTSASFGLQSIQEYFFRYVIEGFGYVFVLSLDVFIVWWLRLFCP